MITPREIQLWLKVLRRQSRLLQENAFQLFNILADKRIPDEVRKNLYYGHLNDMHAFNKQQGVSNLLYKTLDEDEEPFCPIAIYLFDEHNAIEHDLGQIVVYLN